MLKLIYESIDGHKFEYNTTEMDEEKAKKQVELRLIQLSYEDYQIFKRKPPHSCGG